MSTDMRALVANIGKRGLVNIRGMYIRVTIRDVKIAYGHVRYFIEPFHGKEPGVGAWIAERFVVIDVQKGEQ